MKLPRLAGLVLLFGRFASGKRLVGAAQGFAEGVTGGGNADPVTPENIQQLVSYLTDPDPRVILIDRTFDFIGSEGKATSDACSPWGTGPHCQIAINAFGWCGTRVDTTVSYDKASMSPINVASNKTVIGLGNKGVIKGKGLRFVRARNIIVQNIHITELNPQYTWGGDAFTFSDVHQVWVDHCTTSLLGRQHYVFGPKPSTAITLSNNYIDGHSNWTAGCDGYHYWAIELLGKGDQITMQNNYIEHTAGRGPSLSATTLLHAVNNVWSDIHGHAIEGDQAGKGLFEGNVFEKVAIPCLSNYKGQLNTCPDGTNGQTMQNNIGRACERNIVSDSANLIDHDDTSFLSEFKGLPMARATPASVAGEHVPAQAGFGRISLAIAK